MTRLAILAAFGVAACAADEEGVHLCIDGDAGGFETVEIALTFSAGNDGPVCTPAVVHVGPADLPYCILAKPGHTYDQLLVLRATGWAAECPVARRELTVPFQDGKLVEHDVELDATCGACGCGDGMECRDGACRPVTWPGVFEGVGTDMDGTPCDPEHPGPG